MQLRLIALLAAAECCLLALLPQIWHRGMVIAWFMSPGTPRPTGLKLMFGDFQPFPMYRFGIIQLKQPFICCCLGFQALMIGTERLSAFGLDFG